MGTLLPGMTLFREDALLISNNSEAVRKNCIGKTPELSGVFVHFLAQAFGLTAIVRLEE